MAFKINKKKVFGPIFGTYFLFIFCYIIYLFLLPTRFEIEGSIDNCCCDGSKAKSVNTKTINNLLELSKTHFFRIFRARLDRNCPFLTQKKICGLEKCSLCTCEDSEVPEVWKKELFKSELVLEDDVFWNYFVNSNKLEWLVEEDEREKGVYVNLQKNKEAFTGYQGQNIWSLIYGENCFQGNIEDLCFEERMLRKLISGLHSSISTHLSEFYRNRTYSNGTVDYFPSFKEYFNRVGDHPERIKNLYFLYAVMTRAINLASENILNTDIINTGRFEDDIQARSLLENILTDIKTDCNQAFNEKELFVDMNKIEIKKKIENFWYNISSLMDCVECEKCKVYGKLQTLGLGTVLKILFASRENKPIPKLKRNELIALINTYVKISQSVSLIDKMFERRKKEKIDMGFVIFAPLGVFLIFLLVAARIYEDLENNMRKKFSAISMLGRFEENPGPNKIKKD